MAAAFPLLLHSIDVRKYQIIASIRMRERRQGDASEFN